MTETVRLWGARFRTPPSPALMRLSRAPQNYFRLVPEDLRSSIAHASELVRAGILTQDEGDKISETLTAIGNDFAAGTVAPSHADEDVHTFLERVLVERLGAMGGKLRAGRSRNDQAANDLKLHLRGVAKQITSDLLSLQDALIAQASEHQTTLAPGFTHLQPAQPVTFAHQLLAHAQGFSRDIERLQDWHRRSSRSPLGAAALAGSAIALHPELSARELGYDAPCENSIDAVGSRDHVAEFLFVCAMIGVNLSRLAEEVFLWSSRQFRWVVLDDGYATGSSIMPQKKNADIAELTRGRAARLISGLNAILTALKGLPFAYNRDLSEDKWAAFEAIDTLGLVLPAMAGMIETMQIDAARLKAQSTEGFTLATEVADWLARNGMPFSEAHEITGALVRYCEENGLELSDLTPADLGAVDSRLGEEMLGHLTPEAAVAARAGYGGTAPARVAEQIERLKENVSRQRDWAKA
ncbi:argininosuccinate lyase [Microvirga lotononidis]|uniref:Argininosuccinate lyase n=1 Tax=Microvirga lotononidis TaxID=864069 RepID=I4Z1N3_9HYPH|nr:argininosuccinate lyase [Microvirga lotononidis]EIM30125.1 argininosuccinate lyase [Microvirga lotononidis]WQO31838.1 argininosuccinate lyase [Microvirga lotononidis]